MDTAEEYSKKGPGEGDPGSINPNEIGRKSPAKSIPGQEKLDINESESGRNQAHRPAEEKVDENYTQIDEGTIKLQEEKKSLLQAKEKQFDATDENRIDQRDSKDSTTDWNAEKSRTSHNK